MQVYGAQNGNVTRVIISSAVMQSTECVAVVCDVCFHRYCGKQGQVCGDDA